MKIVSPELISILTTIGLSLISIALGDKYLVWKRKANKTLRIMLSILEKLEDDKLTREEAEELIEELELIF